jgi:hypothetical protein
LAGIEVEAIEGEGGEPLIAFFHLPQESGNEFELDSISPRDQQEAADDHELRRPERFDALTNNFMNSCVGCQQHFIPNRQFDYHQVCA